MLYLLAVEDPEINTQAYFTFETHTESIIYGTTKCVRRLINACKMEPINMYLTSKGIQIKDWPQDIKRQPYDGYILLAKLDNTRFKLVRTDGKVIYMNAEELTNNIKLNNVLNCSYENNTYKSIDTYTITKNDKFDQHIAQKYKEFTAKMLLLGYDMKFDYNIENLEVRLLNYTGRSSRVILPNFITSIAKSAFASNDISEITLNEGLKYIGQHAFSRNDIKQVIIPKTVKFVGYRAFERNTSLADSDGDYKETVKKLSNRTIILQ